MSWKTILQESKIDITQLGVKFQKKKKDYEDWEALAKQLTDSLPATPRNQVTAVREKIKALERGMKENEKAMIKTIQYHQKYPDKVKADKERLLGLRNKAAANKPQENKEPAAAPPAQTPPAAANAAGPAASTAAPAKPAAAASTTKPAAAAAPKPTDKKKSNNTVLVVFGAIGAFLGGIFLGRAMKK